MKEIRVKISDLFEIEPGSGDRPQNLIGITAHVLKHYAFLPKPIVVTLEGDEVVISYPEEADRKREEAARLAARAVKRASEGSYEKAIRIYKRVLELQSSFHAARRDLAMAYMEIGDIENATNYLIEVLRLDPGPLTKTSLSTCDGRQRFLLIHRIITRSSPASVRA